MIINDRIKSNLSKLFFYYQYDKIKFVKKSISLRKYLAQLILNYLKYFLYRNAQKATFKTVLFKKNLRVYHLLVKCW